MILRDKPADRQNHEHTHTLCRAQKETRLPVVSGGRVLLRCSNKSSKLSVGKDYSDIL